MTDLLARVSEPLTHETRMLAMAAALDDLDAALAENAALWRVAHAFDAFQQHPLIPRGAMYQSPGSLLRRGREALASVPPRDVQFSGWKPGRGADE